LPPAENQGPVGDCPTEESSHPLSVAGVAASWRSRL
jgi:hypothetical protein